jgi:hypothetical protein
LYNNEELEFLRFCRKRRDTSTDVDDSLVLEAGDLPSIATNESAPTAPLHNETLSWPTPGGITENEATDACKNPIMQSPVYSQCINFTKSTLDSLVKSCVEDVQVNNGLDCRHLQVYIRNKIILPIPLYFRGDTRTPKTSISMSSERSFHFLLVHRPRI